MTGKNHEEVIPYEKWLVAFTVNDKTERRIMIREFFAQGFYEAFDTVMKYAEKTDLEIIWFREKRNCGYPRSNHNYTRLESFCTYCNNKFNHQDPIPCLYNNCYSSFCSQVCMKEHLALPLHRNF